jgi:predicted HicB family RNase H-like nuclease
MAAPKAPKPIPQRGRPATGATRKKISLTIPTLLLEKAAVTAIRKGESVSQFVARAIQNLLMQS